MSEKTKLVRITLTAQTRMEYTEIVEVPVNMTEHELNVLVAKRYDEVDGTEFVEDPEYWERGYCHHETVDRSEVA